MDWLHRFYTGRLSRQNYVYSIFSLAFFFLLAYSLLIFIPLLLGINDISPIFLHLFAYGFTAILVFFASSLYARRFHDLGRSGWWSFISLIPVAGFVIGLVLLAVPGNEKENKYSLPQDPDSFDLVNIFFPKNLEKEQTEQKTETPQ